MKILHTSDWHVGKVLKGQSRAEEHKAVLAGVIDIARAEQPDLVIVAGDLYDTKDISDAAKSSTLCRRRSARLSFSHEAAWSCWLRAVLHLGLLRGLG